MRIDCKGKECHKDFCPDNWVTPRHGAVGGQMFIDLYEGKHLRVWMTVKYGAFPTIFVERYDGDQTIGIACLTKYYDREVGTLLHEWSSKEKPVEA